LRNNVSTSNLIKKLKKIELEIAKIPKDKTFIEGVIRDAEKEIRTSTRKELNAGTGEKLKTIKSSTISSKKQFSKYNNKGVGYRDTRSNLTRSGQLLNSIKGRLEDGKIRIGATGSRKPYKGKNGYYKNAPSNKEVAGYLKEKGFEFISVGKVTIKKAERNLRNAVIELIRRIGK